MSTSAYFVFKYRGKFYAFFNHFDGYPAGPYGLGFRIIRNLATMTKEMLIDLLEHLVAIINAKEKEREKEKEEYKDNDYSDEDDEKDEVNFVSIEHALRNPFAYRQLLVSSLEPGFIFTRIGPYESEIISTYDASYFYIINADEELFAIKSWQADVYYPLFRIPADWYDLYDKVVDSKALRDPSTLKPIYNIKKKGKR